MSKHLSDQIKQNALTKRYGGAPLTLLLLIAFGALIVIAYSAQAQSIREFISMSAAGLLISGASLSVGSIIGFLFGIPRSLAEERQSQKVISQGDVNDKNREKTKYRPNTNLEEISDWLTKILVGVGLTQLDEIRGGLRSIGQTIAPLFGGTQNSEVFAMGMLIYFAVCGFFITFLWARLILRRLYDEADLVSAKEEGEQIGTERFLESTQKASEFLGSTQKASEVTDPKKRFALWVDDKPENNERERELMSRLLGLEFKNVLSTNEAVTEVSQERDKYDVVISDMSRPDDERAGYTLLEKLKAMGREMGYNIPVIFYTGYARPEDDAEARRRGAKGLTNNPQKLLDLVRVALTRKG